MIYSQGDPLNYYNVKLECNRYTNGRFIIILLFEEDDVIFAVATKNIPAEELQDNEVIIKDYAENKGMLEFLIKNNIVLAPHRYVYSGFVKLPVCYILIEEGEWK